MWAWTLLIPVVIFFSCIGIANLLNSREEKRLRKNRAEQEKAYEEFCNKQNKAEVGNMENKDAIIRKDADIEVVVNRDTADKTVVDNIVPLKKELYESLNEQQIAAVQATEGRIKVAAGAGTGKTKVLASRYAHIAADLGVPSSNILCLTFTNKAAHEMRSRIAKLLPAGDIPDFICTFHGFCAKVLRREIYRIGYPKTFTIIDDEDAKTLANQVFEEYGISRKQNTISQFLNKTVPMYKGDLDGKYVEELLIPNTAKKVILNDLDGRKKEVKRYIFLQQKNYALDFSDLIYCTKYILKNFKDARDYWQKQFDYILVDEGQDCSTNEWELLDILSEKNNNLFIVGDPDQAIYEWRGARPMAFVNFESDKTFILDRNYRSTPNILDVANSIIKNNKKRIEKNLFTKNSSGEIAVHHHAKSELEESAWIAKTIKDMINSGISPDSFAILYRASYLSFSMERALMDADINYVIWGGIRFFERKEIKDTLAYLGLIAFNSDIHLRRIINTPSRKFGKKSIEKLQELADSENIPMFDALCKHYPDLWSSKNDVGNFINLIGQARDYLDKMSISDLLEFVLWNSGLENMYRADGDEERLENISELQSFIKNYESSNKEEDITLASFLQDISLYTNMDKSYDGGCVKLMTIHQSKGLEFPYVFVIGMNEGVFPSLRTIRERKADGLEEERRLMYVAATRAEKILFLTESEGFSHSGMEKYPSRFILEVKDGLLKVDGDISPELYIRTKELALSIDAGTYIDEDLKNWAFISHDTFGNGVIVDSDNDSYDVLFLSDNKIRHLKSSFIHMMNNSEYCLPANTLWIPVLSDDNSPEVRIRINEKDAVLEIHQSDNNEISEISYLCDYIKDNMNFISLTPINNGPRFFGHIYEDKYMLLKEDKDNSEYYLYTIDI